jgi:DNA-binding response OmpR family regulator
MANILLIEDEIEIRDLIRLHLLRDSHQVLEASSVEEAEPLLRRGAVDLAVVDWMLPGLSGMSFVKHLQSNLSAAAEDRPATLMVTAKSEPDFIIEALEAGADDYLTKPFDPGVLMARVRALLRRQKNLQNDNDRSEKATSVVQQVGEVVINLETYDVTVANEPLHLTISEFKLLAALIKNRGRVLTRAMLVNEIQGDGISVVGRTIDTHVFGLRRKLGASGDLIETVRGVGYRVKAE